MDEINETGVLRGIVEKLAAIDPWDSDGPRCRICGSTPVLRRSDSQGGYFYADSEPGTHTTDCPWRLADEWKTLQNGDGR